MAEHEKVVGVGEHKFYWLEHTISLVNNRGKNMLIFTYIYIFRQTSAKKNKQRRTQTHTKAYKHTYMYSDTHTTHALTLEVT